MSLLNDALRRASQSDRNRPRPAQSQTSLNPVRRRRGPSEKRGHSLALALGIGSVAALGLAVWFFWQLWSANHALVPAALVATQPAPAPVIRADIAPPTLTVSPPPTSPPKAATAPAAAIPAPTKRVGDGWPADLKLMGIFFRETNPQALISGKTVGVGDEIDGIRVTKIENDQVTVEWNGKVKELKVNDGGI